MQWETLSQSERGDRLAHALALGCSRRRLAHELGRSEGCVRRYLRIAALPDEERRAIAAGANAQAVLAAAAKQQRGERRQDRVQEDKQSGRYSQNTAELLIALVEQEAKLTGAHAVQAMNEAERMEYRRRSSVRPSPRGGGAEHIIARCRPGKRPPNSSAVDRVNWVAEWMARVLPHLAPEAQICDAAVRKAKAHFLGRLLVYWGS